MEVDRVMPMGGVGRNAEPVWPRSTLRRRKFVEEIAELDPDEESAGASHEPDPEDSGPDPELGSSVNVLA